MAKTPTRKKTAKQSAKAAPKTRDKSVELSEADLDKVAGGVTISKRRIARRLRRF